MLKSLSIYPAVNYMHIEHTKGIQFYCMAIKLIEQKEELAIIKTEFKKVKKHLLLIHLSLIQQVRHSRH